MNLIPCHQSAEMDYVLTLQFHMPFYTLRHFNISEIKAPWLFFGFLQELQRLNDFETEEQSVSPWYYFYLRHPPTGLMFTDLSLQGTADFLLSPSLFKTCILSLSPPGAIKIVESFVLFGRISDVSGQEHCVDILISNLMQETRTFLNLLCGLGNTHSALRSPLISVLSQAPTYAKDSSLLSVLFTCI